MLLSGFCYILARFSSNIVIKSDNVDVVKYGVCCSRFGKIENMLSPCRNLPSTIDSCRDEILKRLRRLKYCCFFWQLSRAVVGCRGLSWAVMGCHGLSRAVKGCRGLSMTVVVFPGLSCAAEGCR